MNQRDNGTKAMRERALSALACWEHCHEDLWSGQEFRRRRRLPRNSSRCSRWALCARARCLVMPEAPVSSAESHLSDAVAMEGRTAVGRRRRFRSALERFQLFDEVLAHLPLQQALLHFDDATA